MERKGELSIFEPKEGGQKKGGRMASMGEGEASGKKSQESLQKSEGRKTMGQPVKTTPPSK